MAISIFIAENPAPQLPRASRRENGKRRASFALSFRFYSKDYKSIWHIQLILQHFMPKLVYKLVVKSVSRNAKLYFIAAVFLASAASFADQTVLQPDATAGKDAYIRADFPSSNFGSAATLFIGLTASNDKLRSLIEFNVSSVPSGDTITSAVLELYVNDSGSGSEVTAEIYALTRSWIEGEVAWDRRTSSLGWVSNGGDFEASAENSTVITSNGLYSFDVTSHDRKRHNGFLTNKGLKAT